MPGIGNGEILMHKKRTGILALVVLLVLAVAAAALYTILKPAPSAGSKTITVHVDHLEGEDTDFTISTDAEYLRQALEQEDLIVGSESQYGLWVETVDGETADEAAQEWWCITKGGEQLNTGADQTPIADGERYELTLTVGYDEF